MCTSRLSVVGTIRKSGGHVVCGAASGRAEANSAAELNRQWASIEAGAETVPHDKVARWLETWGTPDFKPWHKQ